MFCVTPVTKRVVQKGSGVVQKGNGVAQKGKRDVQKGSGVAQKGKRDVQKPVLTTGMLIRGVWKVVHVVFLITKFKVTKLRVKSNDFFSERAHFSFQ